MNKPQIFHESMNPDDREAQLMVVVQSLALHMRTLIAFLPSHVFYNDIRKSGLELTDAALELLADHPRNK